MSHHIIADNARDAWRLAVDEILQHNELFNLVTTVREPVSCDDDWLQRHCPKRAGFGNDSIRDVIQTIFPYALASRYADRESLYRAYLCRHDRAMRFRRNRGTWGTYFERLVRFPERSQVNQLEVAIAKLTNWQIRSTTGLVFHLATPTVDTPRTRGGPCWHYGEIIWRGDGKLDLVAVYRNHDFMNKALGNFIGLGMLLNFLANESHLGVGQLICHSIHAYNGGTSKALKSLAE